MVNFASRLHRLHILHNWQYGFIYNFYIYWLWYIFLFWYTKLFNGKRTLEDVQYDLVWFLTVQALAKPMELKWLFHFDFSMLKVAKLVYQVVPNLRSFGLSSTLNKERKEKGLKRRSWLICFVEGRNYLSISSMIFKKQKSLTKNGNSCQILFFWTTG